MSLKKDNYKSLDKKIMNFAINIAENNKYLQEQIHQSVA